jgi:hypothetical protein
MRVQPDELDLETRLDWNRDAVLRHRISTFAPLFFFDSLFFHLIKLVEAY